MCRSNFRIKLDLCKFYNDVRRYCWIFIDSTRMFQIIHIIEHIVKLFNIKEPFHLLLNEIEYLPPNEDIRILKENEIVLVSPGSGLKDQFDLAVSTTALPENQTGEKSKNTFVKLEQNRNLYQHDQLQLQTSLSSTLSTTVPHIVSCSVGKIISNPVEQMISDSVERTTLSPIERKISTPVAQVVSTAVQQTVSTPIRPTASTPILQKVSSPVEQKIPTSFQQTESMSVQLSSDSTTKSQENFPVCQKRKRYRRTKKKLTKLQTEYPEINEDINNLKKPMIINYCTIPSGKHIRFDNIDDKTITEKDTTSVETMNDANTTNISPPCELANLLSLGQNSTPLTFTNIRVKDEIEAKPISDVEISSNLPSENIKQDITVTNKVDIGKELSDTDFETYPIMTTKPQLSDVIAFQILKMGMDYTPQLSNFIVAEVLHYCPETLVYTLKISQGLTVMQKPNGKFALTSEEEENTLSDIATLSYKQILKPRLISTCASNGSINPVNSTDY